MLDISEQWESPHVINYPSIGGSMSERYKHENGASEDDLVSVCVSNRKWEQLNRTRFSMIRGRRLSDPTPGAYTNR